MQNYFSTNLIAVFMSHRILIGGVSKHTHLSMETADSGGGRRPTERSSTTIHALNTSIMEESCSQYDGKDLY
jgi:hypothetical protein